MPESQQEARQEETQEGQQEIDKNDDMKQRQQEMWCHDCAAAVMFKVVATIADHVAAITWKKAKLCWLTLNTHH